MAHHPTTESILDLFRRRGDVAYCREPVSLREHALQAAALAERDGAEAPMIVAALLHDIGRMIRDFPEEPDDLDVDLEHDLDHAHEEIAAEWLAGKFAAEVVEPVSLHVEAKRYLCAVEPAYLEILSIPALMSLAIQGGPMSPGEVRAFRANPHHEAALRLRRWDDEAKVPELETPTIEHFAPWIDQVVLKMG